jgi:hypothetical protein
MTLATITLTAQTPPITILLPYFSSQPVKIFEEEVRVRKCEEFHVDELVTVKIR